MLHPLTILAAALLLSNQFKYAVFGFHEIPLHREVAPVPVSYTHLAISSLSAAETVPSGSAAFGVYADFAGLPVIVGACVMTISPLYGIIKEINDDHIVLEIATNVKIKIDKNSIFADASAANHQLFVSGVSGSRNFSCRLVCA